jgi:ISXO2-like transposase domain/Transposase zinc-ribbon domain
MSVLSEPPYHREEDTYAFVEAHIWANGRVCPRCGVFDKSGPLKGKSTRIGLYKCYACRKPFTVKIGTIFEAQPCQAAYLAASDLPALLVQEGHQQQPASPDSWRHPQNRMVHEPSYSRNDAGRKAAQWLGRRGKFVEADETYVGGKAKNRAYAKKLPRHEPVVALVERNGRVASFHVPNVNAANLKPILKEQISPKSDLRTDESRLYLGSGKGFVSHETVNHSAKEYVRGDAHTNTVEGYFGNCDLY